VASHSSTLFSRRFAADILLLVCRSYSKDEYTAAIEWQANNWRDFAAEMSSRFEAIKSELDKAVKKSALELDRQQRTTAEVEQLLSSARASADYFERSAAECGFELTSKQALLKESEQTQDLLSSKLVSQVHVLFPCLMCTQSIFCCLQCLLVCPLRLLHPLWRLALHGSSRISFSIKHKLRSPELIIVLACSIMLQTLDALLALCCGMLISWCDAGRRQQQRHLLPEHHHCGAAGRCFRSPGHPCLQGVCCCGC